MKENRELIRKCRFELGMSHIDEMNVSSIHPIYCPRFLSLSCYMEGQSSRMLPFFLTGDDDSSLGRQLTDISGSGAHGDGKLKYRSREEGGRYSTNEGHSNLLMTLWGVRGGVGKDTEA